MAKAALTMLVVVVIALGEIGDACAARLIDDPPALPADAAVDPDVIALVAQRTIEARKRPSDAEARRVLAMTFHANGLLEFAATTYRQAIELNSGCARCWSNLAIITAQEESDLDAAIACADRAIALDKNYAPIRVRRAQWLLDSGRLDDAAQGFDSALAIDKTSIAAEVGAARVLLRRGEAASAASRLETAARSIPNITDDPAFRLALGTAYGRLGKLEMARAILNSVGKSAPVMADPWLEEIRGHRAGYRALMEDINYLLATGQAEQAVATAERVLRSRPGDVDATMTLAQARTLRNELPAARSLLEGLLQKHADNYSATVLLATVCDAMGERPRAMELAARATTLDPGRPQAWVQVARMQAEQGQFAPAAESFGRAIASGSQEPGVWIARGRLLIEVGDFPGAARVMEQLMRNEPFIGASYVALARARAEQGDLASAASLLERGRQLDPADPLLDSTTQRLAALQAAQGARP